MRITFLRLRTSLSERLHSDGYRKSIKIGRVLIAGLALVFGISTISGIRENTHAAARLTRSGDRSLDGAILATDFQFIGQGQITAGSDSTWLIGELPVRVDSHTQLGSELHPGAFVSLSGRISEDQVWFADRIELAQKGASFFSFNGPLEKTGAEAWQVGGHALMVNAQTVLGENLAVNEVVLVTFTILKNGKWLSLEIKPFAQFPVEPTPIQAPPPTGPVISDSRPGSYAKEPPSPKKKDSNSKGKKDSKSRGKSASHRKNKK